MQRGRGEREGVALPWRRRLPTRMALEQRRHDDYSQQPNELPCAAKLQQSNSDRQQRAWRQLSLRIAFFSLTNPPRATPAPWPPHQDLYRPPSPPYPPKEREISDPHQQKRRKPRTIEKSDNDSINPCDPSDALSLSSASSRTPDIPVLGARTSFPSDPPVLTTDGEREKLGSDWTLASPGGKDDSCKRPALSRFW